MKTTKIYKIVTKDLRSCTANYKYMLPELVVQYRTNEWTTANKGFESTGLFCFTSLEFVKMFFMKNPDKENRWENWIVFEGEGVNVRPKQRIVKLNKHFCIERVMSLWGGALRAFGFKVRNYNKHGFSVADAIKLTNIIGTPKDLLNTAS